MERLYSPLGIIAAGIVYGLVAWRGYNRGELLFDRYSSKDTPIKFYFALAVYFIVAVTLITWGILSLFGIAKPIHLT
jgi:hypothetical protein